MLSKKGRETPCHGSVCNEGRMVAPWDRDESDSARTENKSKSVGHVYTNPISLNDSSAGEIRSLVKNLKLCVRKSHDPRPFSFIAPTIPVQSVAQKFSVVI